MRDVKLGPPIVEYLEHIDVTLALRTENSSSTAFVVDGVGADHRATDVLR